MGFLQDFLQTTRKRFVKILLLAPYKISKTTIEWTNDETFCFS